MPGIARLSFNCRYYHIEDFPRTGKMNLEMPGCFTLLQDLLHEFSEFVAHHRLLIVLEKRMAMEFNKNPIRPPLHSDVRALPTPEAIHLQRIVVCQRAVVDSRNRQAMKAPGPLNN